jgi:hypothetical protein
MNVRNLPPLYFEVTDAMQRWFRSRVPADIPVTVEVTLSHTIAFDKNGLMPPTPHARVRIDNFYAAHAFDSDLGKWKSEVLRDWKRCHRL